MAVKVREKPKGSGVWWIFIDHQGKRKSKKIGSDIRLAREVAKKIEAKLTLGEFGFDKDNPPKVLFKNYAEQWLEGYVKATCKYSTYKTYLLSLNKHLIRAFGKKDLEAISREDIKSYIFQKIKEGLEPNTVKRLKSILSAIFTHAIEDGCVRINPASRLGKFLNAKDNSLDKEISPLTAPELNLYLETCKRYYPRYYPLFLTLARTGMRLGEALGLKWGDIDFNSRFIDIKRAWVENRTTTPKSGKPRRVRMTPQLMETLRTLLVRRKEEAIRKGWGEVPEWVFINEVGKPLNSKNLRHRIHYKVCEKAGLRRFRIHDLRHTYATLRIAQGHNIADVSRQLGHSSIKITVDIYYHWIPSEQKNEVDELDHLSKEAQPNAPYTQPHRPSGIDY